MHNVASLIAALVMGGVALCYGVLWLYCAKCFFLNKQQSWRLLEEVAKADPEFFDHLRGGDSNSSFMSAPEPYIAVNAQRFQAFVQGDALNDVPSIQHAKEQYQDTVVLTRRAARLWFRSLALGAILMLLAAGYLARTGAFDVSECSCDHVKVQ